MLIISLKCCLINRNPQESAMGTKYVANIINYRYKKYTCAYM